MRRTSLVILSVVLAIMALAPTASGRAPVQSAPDNDSFANARSIAPSSSPNEATTSFATTEVGEPQGCSISDGTVWFVFRPETVESIAVTTEPTDGSNRRLRLGLHKGTSLSGLKDHDCYDPADPHPSLWEMPGHLNFWAYPGTTYYIQVAEMDSGSTGGGFALTLEPFDEPEPDLGYRDPCRDDRFDASGLPRVRPRTVWYLKANSIPSHLSKRDAVGAIKRAIRTLNGSGNDCGLADQVDIRASYGGTTRASASVCHGRADDKLVFEFTNKLSSAGRNCAMDSGRKYATDSDIFLNNRSLGIDPLVNRCDDRGVEATATHDLEGVALHELVHAHGIDHVPGEDPSLLTMVWGHPNCSSTNRTLGLGDVLALRRRY